MTALLFNLMDTI